MSDTVERLAKQAWANDCHCESLKGTERNARWWLRAIAEEIESNPPRSTFAYVADYLREQADG